MSESNELLATVREIRELLLLIAEPAIAARDQKLRDELKRIVGKSPVKAKAVLNMVGGRTQRDIHNESGMHEGNLSTLVKQLRAAKLLSQDVNPTLVIPIPPNFFDSE
jgi:hypothetical protein